VSAPSRRADGAPRVTFGDPDAAGSKCRHCGEIGRTVSEDGRIVWYHAPRACCEASIDEAAALLEDELEYLRDAYRREASHVDALLGRIEDATGADERRARAEHERAKMGLERKRISRYEPRAEELKAELSDLRRARVELERSPPRPYREDS
jgi:hypothetical protein